jgi:hypothetical protein
MATFDAQSNRRIVKSVLQTEGWVRAGVSRARNRRPIRGSRGTTQIAKTTTAITAYDDATSTLGTGSVQPYLRDDSSVVADGDAVTGYTVSSSGIDDNTWVMIATDRLDTTWIMPFAADVLGVTQSVVTGIEWNDGDGNIVVSHRSIEVLEVGSTSESTEPTEVCTP